MSFRLGDVLVDRLQYGYAATNDANKTPLYVLSQLSEASIEITTESTEVKDARGNLIKTVYKSKSGSFTATNAFINGNILGTTSGADPVYATSTAKITMPRIITAKGTDTTVEVKGLVEGSLKVNELTGDGAMGKAFALDTAADATHFSVAGETLTLPVDAGVTQFIITYDRQVEDGVKISNSSKSFPKSVYLLLKAIYTDPCDTNAVKSMYIEIPNFQVSPDVTITINTESTMDLKGNLQMTYCDGEKVLYNVYFVDDDEDAE